MRVKTLSGQGLRGLLVATILSVAPPATGQTVDGVIGPLLVPVTKNKGRPTEEIIGFEIAPGAENRRLRDDDVAQLGSALTSRSLELQRSAEMQLGIQVLGDTQGGLGALGTLAQHALWLEQFGDLNNAMNNIGFAMALAQVARDGWNGNTEAALGGGIKAWMNFAIGRWGTGAMQVGAIAVFVFDVTLRQWQSGLSEIAKDVQGCHYMAWYKEHPRTKSEWILAAWKLYLEAEQDRKKDFGASLDKMLDDHVALAFKDPMILTYGDCGGSSFGGRKYTEAEVKAEYKALLQKMLADKVMPEIGDRAWLRTLRAQVKLAEDRLMPRLNQTLTLEVTAYGYPGGTPLAMVLPAGGEWRGKLRDDGTFKARLTRYAILKAGLPDTIRLDGPDGSEERRLALASNRLTAMFGAPETVLVSRYDLTEGAGTCTIKRISTDGSISEETMPDEAHPDQSVDFAMQGNGTWVFGRYMPGSGWQTASPGVAEGKNILFGAPYFDRISALNGCTVGFLQDDRVLEGDCRITRYDEKQVTARTRIQRTCTAPATIALAGIYTTVMTGEMTYYPLDGPEGKMLIDILKKSMKEGFVGGMPDLSALPPMPGGSQ